MPGCFRKTIKRPIVDAQRDEEGWEKRSEVNGASFAYDEQEHAFILDDRGNPFEQASGQESPGMLWVEDEDQIDLETVYFEFDKYNITPDQMKSVQRTAQALKKLLKDDLHLVVVVHGHACNSAGSWKYNMVLSELRAKEIKKALVRLGVDEKRLKIVGHGFEMPKVPGGTCEQQAANRRVEFSVVRNKKPLTV